MRGGRGGKRLAGISPGMGALEIHDQGSNAAKTRGICFPALSVPVTLRECFPSGLSERLRVSGARRMRFLRLPGFRWGLFRKYPRKYRMATLATDARRVTVRDANYSAK